MGLAREQVLVVGILLAFMLGFFSAEYYEFLPTGQTALAKLPSLETYEASVDIVAVKQQGEVGVVSRAVAEIIEGKGRVLFSLNPFVEPDTQQSAETAALVAQQVTGMSLADRDVIYAIEDIEAKLVGGPSAGAALTVATIAALEGKNVREDVGITGTILDDGSIGQIGGVIEKAAAVAEQGKTLFLVPKGQSVIKYYEQQVTEERRGFITIQRVRYVPKELDLNEFSKEQEWNLKIKEVADIAEVVGLMLE
jgi:uncharacterized protein